MKTYEEAVNYILSVPKFAKKTGTENLTACLELFGHPERDIPAIHVAGTNGKGSTCAFLESILLEMGYKVGVFSSPHLEKINERIRINRVDIGDEAFAELFDTVQEILENCQPYPSFFEVLFIMASVYFRRQQVDIAIYETGMGGRLDATNVLTPALTVITSIGLDHTEYLGETIAQIAFEKAGIIKQGVPVVTFHREPEGGEVIRNRAETLAAPYFCVEKKDFKIAQISGKSIDFSIDSEYYKSGVWRIQRTGLYQIDNAALAATALLVTGVFSVTEEAVKNGLWKMRHKGRMEEVRPDIWFDGAHNTEAVGKWKETVTGMFDGRRKRLLFAVAKDKAYAQMIPLLCSGIQYEKVYVTGFPGGRAAAADTVAALFRTHTAAPVEAIPDCLTAYETAEREKQEDELLFVVGSLYLLGELRRALADKRKE